MGGKRQRWTATTRTSSGCSRSTGLAAARPAGLGARLYEQERRRLAETLEKMRDDDRAGA